MSEVLVASKVVTSSGVHAPGWVRIEDGSIVEVGSGVFVGECENICELGHVTVVPGFVDAHVHGGGGSAYPEANPTELAAAIVARDAHLARGTTASMASLVTAQPEELLAQVTALAPLVAGGALRGIHLEGPWLNPARKGAHDERALREPDLAEIEALLEAGGGAIQMVTIAPELPGALAAIKRFVAAGVVVAIGHTDADFEQTKRAIEAGATVATHLFNAMPPLLHRAPGPVLALLEDERVTLELVADGVHLHPELVSWVEHSAGVERVMLVTDAMGAAACGDGNYRLGTLDVTVVDGVARIAGTDTIAGSTATMDALFRQRAIQRPLEDVADEALVAAVQMTATNPARAMAWADIGDISPGKRADLVVLNEKLQTEAVFLAGKQLKVS